MVEVSVQVACQSTRLLMLTMLLVVNYQIANLRTTSNVQTHSTLLWYMDYNYHLPVTSERLSFVSLVFMSCVFLFLGHNHLPVLVCWQVRTFALLKQSTRSTMTGRWSQFHTQLENGFSLKTRPERAVSSPESGMGQIGSLPLIRQMSQQSL